MLTMKHLLLSAFIAIASPLFALDPQPPVALESVLPRSGRVIFLGDSITHDGHYITLIEAALRSTGVDAVPELINLGLPSETCSGLSEPDHPFPRPNVQERLDRALAKSTPDVVFVCYGMNDGIYHPFSEERFTAYRKGIETIVSKVRASGAKIVLMTPPAFDPQPMRKKGKLLPLDSERNYAWFAIYEDYDDVLARYAGWVLSQRGHVDRVIDLHTPVKMYLRENRAVDPEFAMSGDGVHVNDEGHAVIARAILATLGRPHHLAFDPQVVAAIDARQILLHNAWLSHVGHLRPGVKSGKPLREAEQQAASMESAYVRRLRSPGMPSAAFWSAARQLDSEMSSPLFNGVDLSGWRGDARFWSVDGGAIRGANSGPVLSSSYLFTHASYRDFRLLFEVRQSVAPSFSTMHSAVAALGKPFVDKGDRVAKGAQGFGFKGPLLMFCHDWGIWDAYRRNRIEPKGHRGTLQIGSEAKGDWNLVEILVKGNRIRFAANGVEVFDFTDEGKMLQASPIGLQLHSNQRPQEFRFRGLVLSANPRDELVSLREGK